MGKQENAFAGDTANKSKVICGSAAAFVRNGKGQGGAEAPVERRFAAVEGCAVASLPVEGEESSTPNPHPSTRALREGGAA